MLLTISVHTQAPYMNTGIYQCTHRYPTCTYKPHTPTCTLKHRLGGFSPWFPNLPLGLRPYVLFRFFCIECFLLLFLEKNTQNLSLHPSVLLLPPGLMDVCLLIL